MQQVEPRNCSTTPLVKRANGKAASMREGEYTQMWELRRSQALAAHASGASGANAAECAAENPYGGTLSITSTTTLPLNCCNNKTTSFSTFKPRPEHTYEVSRPHMQVGMDAILRQSLQGMPVYFEYDPNGEPCCEHSSRPDLLSDSNNPYGTREEMEREAGLHRCPGRNAHDGSASMRELCDHCAVHAHAARTTSDASHDSLTQSV